MDRNFRIALWHLRVGRVSPHSELLTPAIDRRPFLRPECAQKLIRQFLTATCTFFLLNRYFPLQKAAPSVSIAPPLYWHLRESSVKNFAKFTRSWVFRSGRSDLSDAVVPAPETWYPDFLTIVSFLCSSVNGFRCRNKCSFIVITAKWVKYAESIQCHGVWSHTSTVLAERRLCSKFTMQLWFEFYVTISYYFKRATDRGSKKLWRPVAISLNHRPVWKCFICNRQDTMKIYWNIVSLFPMICLSKNVDHNSGGFQQFVKGCE
jgi:hypothetical protein